MNAQMIDWTYLIPGMSLLDGHAELTTYISLSLFVFMIAIFSWCCFILVRQYRAFMRARLAIVDLVSNADRKKLASHRELLLQRASASHIAGIKELWREFDESLVYSADLTQLYNTLDADHFFNARTLASGLTSNRLLAATPSFLTAIGVLGTFLGLTLGMSGLNFSSNELDELKQGINQMISGAGVAFVSSVWGVFFSLILNWIEKKTERDVLEKITSLQHQIDYLYPRLPAEKVLVDISDHSRESRNTLSGLAEQIGEKLQQSVESMSKSMQEAIASTLERILNPALQTMSTNASQQSTQALEALIEQFSSGLRAEGERQKASMNGAADSVNSAMESISNKMDTMFTQLAESQAKQTQLDAERMAAITEQFESQKKISEEQQLKLTDQFSQQVKSLSDHQVSVISELTSASGQQIAKFSESVQEKSVGMAKAFDAALDSLQQQAKEQFIQLYQHAGESDNRFKSMLEAVSDEQNRLLQVISEGVKSNIEQAKQLAHQHQQLLDKLTSATTAVEQSSSHMNSSATQLGILSGNLRGAADLLSDSTDTLATRLAETASQNELTLKGVQEQVSVLNNLESSIIDSAAQFENTAKLAETGFITMRKHQDEFLNGVKSEFVTLSEALRQQVLKVESQTSEWLDKYSEEVSSQVSERMDEWNKQTLKFTSQMVNTVNAINGILDDLSVRE